MDRSERPHAETSSGIRGYAIMAIWALGMVGWACGRRDSAGERRADRRGASLAEFRQCH
jgi:hypothetical protein